MGVYTFAVVFLMASLMLLDDTLGVDSASKSRLRGLDRRYQFARFPLSDLLLEGKDESLDKRQEQFDDYGHMRFGKRGEESDDYGHMRFGKSLELSDMQKAARKMRKGPSGRNSKNDV